MEFVADPQENPGPGVIAMVNLYDVTVTSVRVYNGLNTDPAMQDINPGLTFALTHTQDDTAPHRVDAYAAGSSGVSNTIYRGIMSQPTPYPYVRLSGAALSAYGAQPPGRLEAVVTYSNGRPRSRLEFGGFVDDVIDASGVANTSRDLLQFLNRRPGSGYTVTNVGVSQTVPQVAYAAVSPTGEIWLRASQIGSQPNQIPPGASNNTPERYAFFPSVFFRRAQYIAQLEAVELPRTQTIIQAQGLLALWQVVRAPTHSKWLFIVDGVPREVILKHPDGSDLRTPLEIWNGLILQLVQGDGSSSVTIYRNTAIIGGPAVFEAVGAVSLGTLHNLDYARFIEPMDSGAQPIVTLYDQGP